MKKLLLYLALTLVHAVLSEAILTYVFTQGMQKLDSGRSATLLDSILTASSIILYFPIVHLSRLAPMGFFTDLWRYVPIVLNSFLWAFLMVFTFRTLRNKFA